MIIMFLFFINVIFLFYALISIILRYYYIISFFLITIIFYYYFEYILNCSVSLGILFSLCYFFICISICIKMKKHKFIFKTRNFIKVKNERIHTEIEKTVSVRFSLSLYTFFLFNLFSIPYIYIINKYYIAYIIRKYSINIIKDIFFDFYISVSLFCILFLIILMPVILFLGNSTSLHLSLLNLFNDKKYEEVDNEYLMTFTDIFVYIKIYFLKDYYFTILYISILLLVSTNFICFINANEYLMSKYCINNIAFFTSYNSFVLFLKITNIILYVYYRNLFKCLITLTFINRTFFFDVIFNILNKYILNNVFYERYKFSDWIYVDIILFPIVIFIGFFFLNKVIIFFIIFEICLINRYFICLLFNDYDNTKIYKCYNDENFEVIIINNEDDRYIVFIIFIISLLIIVILLYNIIII